MSILKEIRDQRMDEFQRKPSSECTSDLEALCWALPQTDLHEREYKVLVNLAVRVWFDRTCDCTDEELSEALRMSIGRIKSALRELRAAGLIGWKNKFYGEAGFKYRVITLNYEFRYGLCPST